MVLLHGIPLAPGDARLLIAILVATGEPYAVSAANRIGDRLRRGRELIALTPEQRDAVLAVLDDPPDRLASLRGALLRHRDLRQS